METMMLCPLFTTNIYHILQPFSKLIMKEKKEQPKDRSVLTLVPDFIGFPKSQLRYLVWFSVS